MHPRYQTYLLQSDFVDTTKSWNWGTSFWFPSADDELEDDSPIKASKVSMVDRKSRLSAPEWRASAPVLRVSTRVRVFSPV